MSLYNHDHKYKLLVGDDPSPQDIVGLRVEDHAKRSWIRRMFWSTLALLVTIPIVSLTTLRAATFFNSTCKPAINTNLQCLEAPVRREWRTLDHAEKTEYIDAVLCLTTQPSALGTNGTLYDDFPLIHQRSIEQFHGSAPFLPWHRLLIHVYEKTLKDRCAYSGHLPYWDWSQDSQNFDEAPVWDAKVGFGGNGASDGKPITSNGTCVKEGPFAGLEVRYFGVEVAPHCLSRDFATGEKKRELGSLIAPTALDRLMKERDYENFASELEHRAHTFIGHSIGGDFLTFTGPNDPIFFLHHGNLDRLWAKWQRKHGNMLAYKGKAGMSTDKSASLDDILDMQGLVGSVAVADVMDTKSGMFCYQY